MLPKVETTASSPAQPNTDPVPLCVDLDGTLLRSDLLWEGLVRLWRRNPVYLLRSLLWWTRGRARLKAEVARRVTVPVETLPWNEEFLAYLKAEQAQGRPIYLVTASDHKAAQTVAAHLGLFRDVLASDGQTNLRSHAKAQALLRQFGPQGFDYAGNSLADLPVWEHARQALVVGAPRWLIRRAFSLAQPGGTFGNPPARFVALWQSLRPRAWTKNLLVFLPLLFHPPAAQETTLWIHTALVALAFSLCASGVYLWDDLMDLADDRARSPELRHPVANAHMPLSWAALGAPLGIVTGLLLASAVSSRATAALSFYVFLAITWSWLPRPPSSLRPIAYGGRLALRVLAGRAAAHLPWGSPGIGLELFPVLLWTLLTSWRSDAAAPASNTPVHRPGESSGSGSAR